MTKYGWTNLHRHSEFSLFDGFGRQRDAARYASELGLTSLGISEHGSISGLVAHYEACKEIGIKAILGCEIYFQPKFNKEKKYYHMCLFCKDKIGYQNLMRLMTAANIEYFYRKPVVTMALLQKYHKGLVCTTACLAGIASQAILHNHNDKALSRIQLLHKLFGDDLYIEIMPYAVFDEQGFDMQLKVDNVLLKICDKYGYKPIITTDSHFIKPEDYEAYQLMYKIGNRTMYADYSSRYMPSENEVKKRFEKRHERSAIPLLRNTAEIVKKCDVDLENLFVEDIPKVDYGEDSKTLIKRLVKEGLKDKGKWNKTYIQRAKHELNIIFDLGFEDYFILCWDIISFARKNNIGYGHGRGSVCGSLVAYAMGITDVDAIQQGTMFERFLRPGKHKMPDIDMDFESERRQEVIDYIHERYKGRTAQIATYGLYKADNLINDLFRVRDDLPREYIDIMKKEIKIVYPSIAAMGGIDIELEPLLNNKKLRQIDRETGVVTLFYKFYRQTRFMGRHAGGVAITCGELTDQFALIKVRNNYQSCFDLNGLHTLKVLKMDILGLKTVSIIKQLEKMTGVEYNEKMLTDKKVIKAFRECDTNGIFQYEKAGAKGMLELIEPTTFADVAVISALNRPGPLGCRMHEQFANAKNNNENADYIAAKYLPETYGCFVYQEDILRICSQLGGLNWEEAETLMKGLDIHSNDNIQKRQVIFGPGGLREKFLKNARKNNKEYSTKEYSELFESMLNGYLFNKGHAVGYCLLSFQQMWYKVHYPFEFWLVTLQNEADEHKLAVYETEASKAGIVILPPHINGTAKYGATELFGERCISKGLSNVKGVGPKAAEFIEANGPYLDKPDFDEKIEKRICNARVLRVLEEVGAFEFNEERRKKQIILENRKIYNRQIQIR